MQHQKQFPFTEDWISVPGYSGGLAACVVFSYRGLLSPWVADPGRGAERFSERFLAEA
jgi:hypothetical protein